MPATSLYQLARYALDAHELLTRHLANYTDLEDLIPHLHGSLHAANLTDEQETDQWTLYAIHAAEHEHDVSDTRAKLANVTEAILGPRTPRSLTISR